MNPHLSGLPEHRLVPLKLRELSDWEKGPSYSWLTSCPSCLPAPALSCRTPEFPRELPPSPQSSSLIPVCAYSHKTPLVQGRAEHP